MAEKNEFIPDETPLRRIGKYALGHDHSASIRLHLQHWMWVRELGYVLNPQIPLPPGTKVADICCGTGIWLIDLAKQHPDIQCDGYDISEDQFPAKGWLPENVNLSTVDVLTPVPEYLRHQYDVVHVGNLVCVVKDDDPSAVLENLKLLLKPGGYLQWDDSDFGNPQVSSPPGSNAPHVVWDEVNQKIQALMLAANGASYRWVRELKHYFQAGNLEVMDDRFIVPGNDISLPWTLQHLMALEEFIKTIDQPVGSAGGWWELYAAAATEMRTGASMRFGLVSCVGKLQ